MVALVVDEDFGLEFIELYCLLGEVLREQLAHLVEVADRERAEERVALNREVLYDAFRVS